MSCLCLHYSLSLWPHFIYHHVIYIHYNIEQTVFEHLSELFSVTQQPMILMCFICAAVSFQTRSKLRNTCCVFWTSTVQKFFRPVCLYQLGKKYHRRVIGNDVLGFNWRHLAEMQPDIFEINWKLIFCWIICIIKDGF